MNKGFSGFSNNNVDDSYNGKAKITIDQREVDKLMKEYKGIKKYMRSAVFEVKKIDGTEKYISSLIEEAKDIDL
jgi:hypothetical protein|tara:strand:+ start:3649 stop:3870 length:222 start_codon:yes stop_codon:yes gene_type:complete